ncbi:WD repeat-containing protein 78-like [Vespa mandarinia]|uniref:WD repeat-containing protein 78-like n=1 Tax=Vespa mandarinia TaxID=7446 RepID=UPI00161FA614|nr:WD repeat-containing protein 78-like [Vespa mandarinia]
MKASDTDNSQRSMPQSITSSKLRLQVASKSRKYVKVIASPLLQERMALRIYEEGIDVTPKFLTHPTFNQIDDRHMTAFEQIAISQSEGNGPSSFLSSSHSGFKSSSSLISRSTYVTNDTQIESLLSTEVMGVMEDVKEKAPVQFYISSDDPEEFHTRPETITIILKETETIIFFEMLPLTSDLRTSEGQAVQESNERYKDIVAGPGIARKVIDAETQTIDVITKSRGTYLGGRARQNEGMFVNNWVIYDTYKEPELMTEKNGFLVVRTRDSYLRMLEKQEMKNKLPQYNIDHQVKHSSDQLYHIVYNTGFLKAARIMEGILSNNIYLDVQKRFTGIVQRDPCSLDLEFTYDLDLLWTYTCDISKDRPVSSFCWNYFNRNIIAVSYGSKPTDDKKDGLLLLWCAKNPKEPGQIHIFDSQISSIDWSHDRPNLLAIGFYNGSIKVIDVSSTSLNIIRQSKRDTSVIYEPHWQVQWWKSDEHFDFQELIYTSNQNGRVYRYPLDEDFIMTEMMKISKIEDKILGVDRSDQCISYDILMNQSTGALVLCQHPTLSSIYFVGSDEGAIYRCSTNYLYHHIDSFLAHDGPIYRMEFSHYCSKLFLTCGADWCTRIWIEELTEPLITLSTTLACVPYATWCPTYSTIIASIVNNEICIWNIKRRTYAPLSVTRSPNEARLVKVAFTDNGKQMVTADVQGAVYIYNLEGIPFSPYNQEEVLIESIKKALFTKPDLLKKLQKTGPPFSNN